VLGSSDLIAFVPTTDLVRSEAFYQGVLGLQVLDETPIARVFKVKETLLRVTLVERLDAGQFTVLGWSVTDMEEKISALTERGVVFERFPGMTQDELGIWTSPGGDRVAWFKDPDGNVLSLTEAR
jgi:catechol 2,3-dioxygenase-like lactoylglutathione lyase family enzyme